jgi:hypothetical protein
MVSKKLLDRLRAAFKRYGSQVLDDPDITIDFFSNGDRWIFQGSFKLP